MKPLRNTRYFMVVSQKTIFIFKIYKNICKLFIIFKKYSLSVTFAMSNIRYYKIVGKNI